MVEAKNVFSPGSKFDKWVQSHPRISFTIASVLGALFGVGFVSGAMALDEHGII